MRQGPAWVESAAWFKQARAGARLGALTCVGMGSSWADAGEGEIKPNPHRCEARAGVVVRVREALRGLVCSVTMRGPRVWSEGSCSLSPSGCAMV